MAIEARGRLVEDQHPRRLVDGARDRGDVLNRDRIVSERLGDIDMQIEFRKQRGGGTAHLGLAHQTEPRRLPSEIEVLRHRQVQQQIDLLIDGRNPRIDRGPGRARRDLGAAEAHDAGVAREDTGHRLDQGGLARAVLPEQRVNFAGPQGEVHLLQGSQRAKTLAQAAHFQQSEARVGTCSHAGITPTDVRINANARHVRLMRRIRRESICRRARSGPGGAAPADQ